MESHFYSLYTGHLIDLAPDQLAKWREDHKGDWAAFVDSSGEVFKLDEGQSAKSLLLSFVAEMSEEAAEALMNLLFSGSSDLKTDATQSPKPATPTVKSLSPRAAARQKRIESNGMRQHNIGVRQIDTDSDTTAGARHSDIQRRKAEARRQRIEGNGTKNIGN